MSSTPITIGTFEAKTKFSEIVRNVQKGKSYTITLRGVPVADIIPRGPADNKNQEMKKLWHDITVFRNTLGKKSKNHISIKELKEYGRK